MTSATRIRAYAKKPSATNARSFRRLLLVKQFAAAEIGERIAQARHETGGMTQDQLADLLNVSTRSVQAYEAGETIPWKYMRTLEEIFKRPMAWFLYGDQAEPAVDETLAAKFDEIRARLERIEQALARGGQDGPTPRRAAG